MTTTYRPIEDHSDLSAYEKLRMQNIIRNNSKLRSLGLISEAEERKSNFIAQGIEGPTNNDEESSGAIDKIDKKRRKREASIPMREGSRKSRRLQKLDAEIKTSLPEERESTSGKDFIEKERMNRIKECREVRLRAAKAIADAGAEKASKENPTASYEHCLMRVKTMTPKKLENRIRVIVEPIENYRFQGQTITYHTATWHNRIPPTPKATARATSLLLCLLLRLNTII